MLCENVNLSLFLNDTEDHFKLTKHSPPFLNYAKYFVHLFVKFFFLWNLRPWESIFYFLCLTKTNHSLLRISLGNECVHWATATILTWYFVFSLFWYFVQCIQEPFLYWDKGVNQTLHGILNSPSLLLELVCVRVGLTQLWPSWKGPAWS